MKRSVTSILTATLAAVLLVGCSGQQAQPTDANKTEAGNANSTQDGETKKYKDELVIQAVADISDLDPAYMNDVPTRKVGNLIMDNLLRYDEKGEIIPHIAEKWEVTPDGKTWTFTIRKGIKFHDGTDLTAKEIKFNYDRLLDPNTKATRASDLEVIQSVEEKDPYTLVFHLKEPYAAFIPKCIITMPSLLASPKAIQEQGKDFNQNPIGSGPYILKEWVPNDRVVLEANPDYFLGAPATKRVVFRVMPDAMTSLIELENGKIDILQKVQPTEAQNIMNNEKLTLSAEPGYNVRWIFFNQKIAPFDDVKVRAALTYAVDRAAIQESLLSGVAELANGFAPSTSWSYEPNTTPYDFSVEKAKELLKEAGWSDTNGDGFVDKDGKNMVVDLNVSNGRYLMDKEIMEVIQNQWKNVGVDAKLNVMEWGSYIEKVKNKDKLGVFFLGYSQDNAEPSIFIDTIFHSEGTINYYNYKNEKVDKLFEQGRVVVDQAERKKLYSEAQKLMADDFPAIPIYSELNQYALTKKVEGFVNTPANFEIRNVKVAE